VCVGLTDGTEADLGSIQEERASSGLGDAGKDLDQRGLAGAVLADERRHSAAPERESYVVQRQCPGILHGDAARLEDDIAGHRAS